MIFVRPLTTLEEFGECVQLQRLIWGWGDLDLLPVRFFVIYYMCTKLGYCWTVENDADGIKLGTLDGDFWRSAGRVSLI